MHIDGKVYGNRSAALQYLRLSHSSGFPCHGHSWRMGECGRMGGEREGGTERI